MKSTSWLDLGGAPSSKIKIRSTLLDAPKKQAESTTYKKRTKMAESSALERKGLRESLWGVLGRRTVNRYRAKGPRILGFEARLQSGRDRWVKGAWRRNEPEIQRSLIYARFPHKTKESVTMGDPPWPPHVGLNLLVPPFTEALGETTWQSPGRRPGSRDSRRKPSGARPSPQSDPPPVTAGFDTRIRRR